MDGATIIKSGWYCVGVATSRAIYYYGCYHLTDTSTRAISFQVNGVIDEIIKITRANIVAACTDNASKVSLPWRTIQEIDEYTNLGNEATLIIEN